MKFYLKTKDYSVSKENFELKHDEDFDMLVTYPQPKALAGYYKSDGYISHTDSKKSIADKLYHVVKSINLKNKLSIVNRHASTKNSLLDIGAGTGDFLQYAKKHSWKITGIEPSDKARKKALEKGISLHECITDYMEQKYDVITLWHVLEHIPNLDNQITKLKELLKPDGVLIIAVPNYKSFDAGYYKEHWAAFDVPRHLWHFSQTSISKLCTQHNFTIEKTYPMLFDAFYVSLLSEKYKNGKQRFIPAFCVGLWSNLKALRSGEYSSLIYVIKRAK